MRSLSILVACTLVCTGTVWAQDASSEWRYYGSDAFSSKYSPLDQIRAENFADLEIAWRWNSVDADLKDSNGQVPGSFKVTPIMARGVLFTSTSLSQVAALNPETGETLWVYDPQSYKRGRAAAVGNQHRGLSYWEDGEDPSMPAPASPARISAKQVWSKRPQAWAGISAFARSVIAHLSPLSVTP